MYFVLFPPQYISVLHIGMGWAVSGRKIRVGSNPSSHQSSSLT